MFKNALISVLIFSTDAIKPIQQRVFIDKMILIYCLTTNSNETV